MTMKASELADLDTDELAAKLAEAKEELFNLRFQNVTGQLDNPHRLREVRKDIARGLTVLHQRGRGGEGGPQWPSRTRRPRASPAGPARSGPGSWSPTRWTRRWSSRSRTSVSTACTRRRSGGRPGARPTPSRKAPARATSSGWPRPGRCRRPSAGGSPRSSRRPSNAYDEEEATKMIQQESRLKVAGKRGAKGNPR